MEETSVKPKNVFKNKNFVLAFFGALVSNMGSLLYSFAVSFYILRLTDNNAFIQGLYLAVGGIVFTIVVLFGGVICDRHHKGKIMYICDYLKGGSMLLVTILLMTVIQENNAKVVALFVLAVIGNIIGGIFSPASSSLLPDIVPPESFQQAQSYYSLMGSVQGIFGIVLAGVMYSLLPINILFLIVAICYLLSGFSEMFIKYDYVKREDKLTVKKAFSDIGGAFKYLVGLKPLLYLVIAVLFVNFFFSPIASNFLPYFIATDLTTNDYIFKSFIAPELWNSIITVVFSIGSMIMAIILSGRPKKDKIASGLTRAFLYVFIVLFIDVTMFVLYKQNVFGINVFLITFVTSCLFLGLFIILINIPISTTILTIVEKDKLGKVNSLIDVGTQGLIPLSNFLSGIVIASLGTSALLIACTVGFFIMLLFIATNKYIKTL